MKQEHQMVVISKNPVELVGRFHTLRGYSNFSLSNEPYLFTHVHFQLVEPGENMHPDDRDIILECPPSIYQSLKKGMKGMAVWEKNKLISWQELP